MRALLPVYCRPLGYFIIALALFLPFIFLLWGKVTDANLLFYKECSKLLMMMGALMIIFALTKNENKEIEQVRNKSTRNAIFLTVLFIFGGMLYRVAQGDLLSVDSSSFLIFLILNVLCLEFGIKKATVDRLFKRKRLLSGQKMCTRIWKRCERSGPRERREFRMKTQLGWKMIQKARPLN